MTWLWIYLVASVLIWTVFANPEVRPMRLIRTLLDLIRRPRFAQGGHLPPSSSQRSGLGCVYMDPTEDHPRGLWIPVTPKDNR